MERVMARLDEIQRRLQALRDESGEPAPVPPPPSPGRAGSDGGVSPLDDVGGDTPLDDEDQSAPPAPRSPLLRYPHYADLEHTRDAIRRKRELLAPLVTQSRGLGMTELARRTGLPRQTLYRLAGPRTTPPPLDLAVVQLCIREGRAYRRLLDEHSALLARMRAEVLRGREQGLGLVRCERLIGVPYPTGAFARRLLRTTHRRPWPAELPDELRESPPRP